MTLNLLSLKLLTNDSAMAGPDTVSIKLVSSLLVGDNTGNSLGRIDDALVMANSDSALCFTGVPQTEGMESSFLVLGKEITGNSFWYERPSSTHGGDCKAVCTPEDFALGGEVAFGEGALGGEVAFREEFFFLGGDTPPLFLVNLGLSLFFLGEDTSVQPWPSSRWRLRTGLGLRLLRRRLLSEAVTMIRVKRVRVKQSPLHVW